ncbi:tRNA pseudouridine(38-40) synthase TruA [Nocardioides sp. GY 10127]|uniref:tRNA pseudouridine(38-40) synthase TruA n=1 Tax=Nocardioides sp. GY 10127 TaxID=2569762 RepID=UPI0010A7BD0A|nr:tRNA pseudouridine(38-40) synthase TruA [Nocardioides sp. GY 10127]TIC81869.1 tRNA pseudouridine(38-40) synthase TruA [Nocardioides sp. GY 10127]
MRLRIDLAYDGTDFSGWAAQPGLRTVQDEVQRALGTALRTDPVPVVCAGRTDAGVHARGQVLHTDVDEAAVVAAAGRSAQPPVDALVRRLNGILPTDVAVRGARRAPDAFDARFSALWRRYAYRVADDPAVLDPLSVRHVLRWNRPLDVEAMAEAARPLRGRHDFAAFCKAREGATTIRTLEHLTWERDAAGLAVAHVRADAFCHSMVRALVGCLLAVGEGRRPVTWPAEVLATRARTSHVAVAHAHGLVLEEVAYPDDAELAARNERTRARRTEDELDCPDWADAAPDVNGTGPNRNGVEGTDA